MKNKPHSVTKFTKNKNKLENNMNTARKKIIVPCILFQSI